MTEVQDRFNNKRALELTMQQAECDEMQMRLGHAWPPDMHIGTTDYDDLMQWPIEANTSDCVLDICQMFSEVGRDSLARGR